MAINPNNGVLDIINGTLKVSSIDIKQAGGFTTAINTVARNDVLLYDDQDTNTAFTPQEGSSYRSATGVTRDTTANAGYIDLNDGWVYWPLQLPNAWHTEFDMHVTTTGGVLTYSLFNTTEPNHTDYTANDGGYKIVFDNTQNQIDIRWQGSVHATTSANIRSADWQHVNINYFQGSVSISLAGKVVLTHKFTENYQEFDSRYVGFSATAGASHKIRHLIVHNADKWLYTKTSNASDISYVSGNVGIGTLAPTELLDVHGNVHIAKDLTVDGNLTVSGTTTFIDTQNLAIEDPIIEVAKGNASDTIDAGLVITRPTSNVAVAYRGDEDELALGYTQSGASDTDVVPLADGGLDVRVYGNVFANNLTTTANVEATYLKGDGSELTHVTLEQVVDYGNTTANTIQLTNANVGLKATGNVEANYFVGDGSRLDNISTTLQEITDNGNVTSNTVQFTNATTAFYAVSNVGIGTSTPSANLHVMGYQYVNEMPTITNSFDHSSAPLTLAHPTPTSSTAINDPKAMLHLTRDGTASESYGARASFNLSRYENTGTASRSRLDIGLADGTYSESTVMTLRADGRVGVGTDTPSETLDVWGNVHVSNNISGNSLTINNVIVSTTVGLDEVLNVSNTSTNTIQITNTSDSALDVTGGASIQSNLKVGTTNFFVDTTTGNVGVGTTNPTHGRMQIVCSSQSPDGGLTVRGGDFNAGLGAMWVEGSGSGQRFKIQAYKNENTDPPAGVNPSTLDADVFELCLNPKGGNVGIGLTSPAQKLDVAGRIRADTMEIDSYIYHVGDTDTYFGFSGDDHFRIVEGGDTRFQVDSNGRIGIGLTNPSSPLHVSASTTSTHTMRITHNDTDATSGTHALVIDANYSGSDTFTGNKTNAGLNIDLDSSADGGDITNEHRIFGVLSDVRHSGDSDLASGIYSYTRSDHTSGTTTSLKAGDFVAVSSGAGINTNIYGINSFAFKDGGSTGATTNMYGVRGEVEVDAGTCTNAFGFQSHIDRDGGTITNGYLYYGNYAGTVGTKWGIYLAGETKNYFSGDVGIATTNPQAPLHVNATSAMIVPVGTTAQQPGTTQTGMVRYNTTNSNLEFYDGSKWNSISGYEAVTATGGTITDITENGTMYRVHTFTSIGSSNFTVTKGGKIDYLIVAGGGGGGGRYHCGGGGGGGVIMKYGISVTPQTYTIVVGDGGAAGVASSSNLSLTKGHNGSNSSAFGQTAIGGGGGGSNADATTAEGKNGGSGGGGAGMGSNLTLQSGDGTPGQGHRGGNGLGSTTSSLRVGGGGGGAGGPGGHAVHSEAPAPGDGGPGIASTISGTLTYYGGGGGGGGLAETTNMARGGIGGGGNGQTVANTTPYAENGIDGTGGGGGGSNSSTNGLGPGGSGIVIIRYRI
jgi:hypothetical protein